MVSSFDNDAAALASSARDLANRADEISERSSHFAQAGLLDGLLELGVLTAFPSLRDSPIEPSRCIEITTRALRFVGHGARKWRDVEAFEGFLGRLSEVRGGQVHFLLHSDLDPAMIGDFVQLQRTHSSFEAKILLEPPLLRMVEIDGRYVSIQAYPDLPTPQNNWDLGGMVFSREGVDTMYPTFSNYITRLWADGVDVAEFDGGSP